jgi:hypothetical protein
MKKLLTLVLISLFGMLSIDSIANDLNKNNLEKTIKPPRIHINFILAKPRTDCEQFPGVCKFELGASYPRYSGFNVGGTGTYENGTLTIEFAIKEMDAAMVKRFSEITIFPIEDPFILSANVCEALIAPPLTIPAGRYTIIRTLSGYAISIKCR